MVGDGVKGALLTRPGRLANDHSFSAGIVVGGMMLMTCLSLLTGLYLIRLISSKDTPPALSTLKVRAHSL